MTVRNLVLALVLGVAACKSGGAVNMDPKVEACKQACDSTKGECVEACKDKTGADAETCTAACDTACNECKSKCDEAK